MKRNTEKLVSKFASKHSIKKNARAFELYDQYRKTFVVVEQTTTALGRKQSVKSGVGSTLNFEVNRHGVFSTKS